VRGLNKKCPSGRRAADRADPWRARPPVGCCQHNTDSTHRRRKSRFRQRVCPRKGCEAVYTPRTGNQRYCQDQQCLQEVRRWQAARRQKRRRLRPDVRKTQAAAAKDARFRKSQLKVAPPVPAEPIVPTEPPQSPDASSRSRKNPGPICARVGCYESPAPATRCPTRYCSDNCRLTMQRVRDRERKCLWRNTLAGRIKCRQQANRRQNRKRTTVAVFQPSGTNAATAAHSDVVLAYRVPPDFSVPSGDRKEDFDHDVQDPETALAPQTRPPPSP
jgi:hypothetical protein